MLWRCPLKDMRRHRITHTVPRPLRSGTNAPQHGNCAIEVDAKGCPIETQDERALRTQVVEVSAHPPVRLLEASGFIEDDHAIALAVDAPVEVLDVLEE
jgi:hypothetical protein|tara:strand:+ start:676 stop:972 length:297 start_codon:yes stop_codon:yes gene_type:complete